MINNPLSFTSQERKQLDRDIAILGECLCYFNDAAKTRGKLLAGKRLTKGEIDKFLNTPSREQHKWKSALMSAVKVIGGKKQIKAIQDGLPETIEQFRNDSLPAFLPAHVKKALSDGHVNLKQFARHHHQMFNSPNWPSMKQFLLDQPIQDVLRIASKVLDKAGLPGPADMQSADSTLMLIGSGIFGAMVGFFTAVVGVIVTAVGLPVIGVPMITAGLGLFVTQWAGMVGIIKDDPDWELRVVVNFRLYNDEEIALLEEKYEGETFIGNTNKRELHRTYCQYLSRMNPDHRFTVESLTIAYGQGYDNCAYCLGNSKR
jgi:hypothetical protein